MKGVTHIAAGVAAGVVLSEQMGLDTNGAIAVTVCSALGSLLPDIDVCTSKLGRMIAPAAFVIQVFIGHRTLFHAPLLYIVLAAVLAGLFPQHLLLIGAAGLGIATHLLLDMLNPSGIPLLWPWNKRFQIPICRSGGIIDWILAIALSGLAAFLVIRFLN